ncbi:ORMDL family-domain-containing protein [Armillaria luteobubalina]|uniref:ORMDL family-domain-containing protein n=1 Tax=Armillaria luteobubalina TaxID=153913 RepID=A0AA39QB57_9AGAR|nr:ORMDL family-domain-containing protein [Armillaria luteobubalina]
MGSRTTSVKLPTLDLSKPSPMRVRGRSGSIVKVEQVGDRSAEDALDQSLFVNINANWVNAKGAWLIHVVLICAGKVLIDTLPGMSQQVSWTLVNLVYLALSYLMFHWVTGMPFEGDLRGGAYDDLTLWEQIDDGAQYTPAKKWLFSVPVVLFLASTHYTNYNPWLFAVNLTALIFVLIPKLPQLTSHPSCSCTVSAYASWLTTHPASLPL